MTSTPEHGADAGDLNAQSQPTQPLPAVQPTQPLPPVQATQPLPVMPAAPAAHPTNPFTPPHPAAPADQRAAYEAAQAAAAQAAAAQAAAAQLAAFQAASAQAAQAEAVRRAQWDAAQRTAAQDPAVAPQPVAPQPVAPQPVQQPFAPQPMAYQTITTLTAPLPESEYVGGGLPPQPTERRRSMWLPVTGVAAAAAILAAIATAGLTHALSSDDSGSTGARAASQATIGQQTNDTVPVSGSTSDSPNWEAVSKAVKESVVAIQVSIGTDGSGAEGSGVIVDDSGHIVTNNHVVADANKDSIEVTLSDGRIFKATVVGTDPTTDLAVIKLTDPPKDLKAAAFGDSAAVVVGQPVMAVGNPLGLASTVTTGIVSAVDRPVSTSGTSSTETTVTNAIQVDAAVNPGNSGGPLFDASGRVIGINSSIATLSQSSGSIGLGFAIPIDLVKNIAAQLISDGTAQHAFLGVSLSDGTATADGVTRRGAVVESVSADSPAAKASLQAKDTIVAIDSKAVAGAESLTAYVRELPVGTKVTLTVVRDGKTSDIDVTLAARTESAASGSTGSGQTPTPAPSDGTQQAPAPAPSDGTQQGGSSGQGGSSSLPGGLSPDELWKWFQSQQQGAG